MQYTIRTYAELDKWTAAFDHGHFDILVLVGDPGLGKSRKIKDRLQSKARIVEGRTTAFQLYRELYWHKGDPFVIDDVDRLYGDREAVGLLKCLCQTEPVKTVAWHSATHKLDRENIPREFETKSKVAIIANIWRNLDANIEAVADRGILLFFEPSAREVHEWVRSWYRTQKISSDVFNFIESHLDLISVPSGRHYITAQQVMNGGLDWQAALFETWGLTEEMAVVVKLLGDTGLTQAEREARFIAETGKSRATFFRLLKDLPETIKAHKPKITPSNKGRQEMIASTNQTAASSQRKLTA